MKSSLHFFIISLLTIGLGIGWLMNMFPSVPNAHWVWTLGMGLAGLLVIALCGVNKLTVVTGPFLIAASVFTILRRSGTFDLHHEMPALVIALGALMLLSVLAPVPAPGWAGAQSKK
jgi:hypothetical protein